MALQKSPLILSSAPIPATFKGGPDALRKAIIERTEILSPSGTNFIFIGDSEPTSNVGPWLKGGDKWYVFDEDIKRYVPIDVSDSTQDEIQISESTPTTSSPTIWLRLFDGKPIGLYFFDGTQWVPSGNIVQSGPTASRPSNPLALQQFYDTDISTLIWFERGAWRTVAGVPGDVKFVATQLLSAATLQNPGWEVLGASQQSWRGRYISQATQDPEGSLTVALGIGQRSSREVYGETDGLSLDGHTHGGTVAAEPISGVPFPPTIALWTLVKT